MSDEFEDRAKYVCEYFGATDGTMATVPEANRAECAATIVRERAEMVAMRNAEMRRAILDEERAEREERAEAKAATVAPSKVFSFWNRGRRRKDSSL